MLYIDSKNPSRHAMTCGLNQVWISYLTFHSKKYVCTNLDGTGNFVWYKWSNISLGNILKIAFILSHADWYKSLWYPPIHTIWFPICQFDIEDYPCWAKNYKTFSRFVQICDAFHPESGIFREENKCNQLQKVIDAASGAFVPGQEKSLDRGGVPCRSSHNPAWQYNKSKLDKYTIYFLFWQMHLMVIIYPPHWCVSGWKGNNIEISPDHRIFPQCKKADMNAKVSTRLS